MAGPLAKPGVGVRQEEIEQAAIGERELAGRLGNLDHANSLRDVGGESSRRCSRHALVSFGRGKLGKSEMHRQNVRIARQPPVKTSEPLRRNVRTDPAKSPNRPVKTSEIGL